jgi:class 3 adenylate cyclase
VAQAHRAAHGHLPTEIIEVSESDVVRFLGKVHDPVDASEVTSAFRIVCFTDLVGSTELLDRLGQSEYMVLLTKHDLIIREALIRWTGREVKHTGDGFMVVFEDVDRALGWSLDVRDSFKQDSELDVRLGIAAGEPGGLSPIGGL